MLDLSKVYKVYSGKSGMCMCGCSGKYKVASAHRAHADVDRGYPYSDEDVSDISVRRTVGKILSAPSPKDEGGHVYAVVGKRIYVAFYKD